MHKGKKKTVMTVSDQALKKCLEHLHAEIKSTKSTVNTIKCKLANNF